MATSSVSQNQPQLSDNVKERLSGVLYHDEGYRVAEDSFYTVMDRVGDINGGLRDDLETALLDIFDALQRALWLDGWRCGQQPERLLLAGDAV